jgi:type IV fimbrial biogenesis protein FimT
MLIVMSRQRERRRSGVAGLCGFTLVELIITIALVALVLTMGLPAFMNMLTNLRVRAVADSVLAGAQVARTEALKRNRNLAFRLDAATGGAWTVGEVDTSNNIITTLQSRSAGDGGTVSVAMTPGGTTQVIFNNLGRRVLPTPAAVDIMAIDVTSPAAGTCEHGGGRVRCLRVTVSIGGEVRLCDPKRPTGDPQAC